LEKLVIIFKTRAACPINAYQVRDLSMIIASYKISVLWAQFNLGMIVNGLVHK